MRYIPRVQHRHPAPEPATARVHPQDPAGFGGRRDLQVRSDELLAPVLHAIQNRRRDDALRPPGARLGNHGARGHRVLLRQLEAQAVHREADGQLEHVFAGLRTGASLHAQPGPRRFRYCVDRQRGDARERPGVLPAPGHAEVVGFRGRKLDRAALQQRIAVAQTDEHARADAAPRAQIVACFDAQIERGALGLRLPVEAELAQRGGRSARIDHVRYRATRRRAALPRRHDGLHRAVGSAFHAQCHVFDRPSRRAEQRKVRQRDGSYGLALARSGAHQRVRNEFRGPVLHAQVA